jgi:CO/xanthine dehydrogenase FAD-binding subunit
VREVAPPALRHRIITSYEGEAEGISSDQIVALALGATLRARSASGERELSAAEFFLGPFTTALEADELLVEIGFPAPPAGSGSAYVSFDHPASGFALAGAAALVRPDGSSSVAVTGLGGRAFVVDGEAELGEAEVADDAFAPAEYRRALAAIAVRRALERARERAG